ncbi:putative sulfate exporter family transporter [Nocardioides panacisoli]|uniref:YeiH family protein n=1 Tax=Nocardioides panacisoli TaxID=627624 RepID=UPI001C629965|nr:putative sulfate exporter family transporter [Nocardioides panacisoli]QYJ03220.1 putative sulfate exporter family transporter [Nocardioides panacisoli]
MTDLRAPTDAPGRLAPLAPAGLAAVAAVAVSAVLPLVGPLLVAVALGAVVANTRLVRLPALRGHEDATKLLLRLGVVLLGLQLPVQQVLGIGGAGLVVVLATVVTTYAATVVIGDRLGLERDFVTLLAAGFSICGAAAIAAVDDAVRAKQRHVALAVALVTIFGSAMILLVPWVADLTGLTDQQAAVWAGASIHEVAQVVAAASLVGPAALAVATTVKLGRVALLAPMYAVAARRSAGSGTSVPTLPWFVVGFAVGVALRSVLPLPTLLLDTAASATTLLLAAAMFGLGLGIRAAELWPVPRNALLLAVASTAVAAGTSYGLVAVLL